MKQPMKKNNKVVVGMSGGVDSSVAALLLLNQGYQVVGATMDTGYGQAPEQARLVCEELGIPHYVVNVRQQFQEMVVNGFVRDYLQGKTPNPCVDCNRNIKFPLFRPLMEQIQADSFSTGHYIQLEEREGRFLLRCAADEQKDQSYFLYGLPQDILCRCLFPLGGLTKPEIRKIALESGLCSAGQKDSYDICFIPSGNYRELLQEQAGDQLKPGEIVDTSGKVLGRHSGLANYTLGQRRGLEVAVGEPVYVLRLDQSKNQLVVGPKTALMHSRVLVKENNFLPFADLTQPMRCLVKIRYKAVAQPACLQPLPDAGQVEILFDQPQWGVTPGQSAVYYDGDYLLGGGKIVTAIA